MNKFQLKIKQKSNFLSSFQNENKDHRKSISLLMYILGILGGKTMSCAPWIQEHLESPVIIKNVRETAKGPLSESSKFFCLNLAKEEITQGATKKKLSHLSWVSFNESVLLIFFLSSIIVKMLDFHIFSNSSLKVL